MYIYVYIYTLLFCLIFEAYIYKSLANLSASSETYRSIFKSFVNGKKFR